VTVWEYEVHVVGDLSDEALDRLRSEFERVDAVPEPASTRITGTVPDQASLVGMLHQLHALGLEVCELRQLPQLSDHPIAED